MSSGLPRLPWLRPPAKLVIAGILAACRGDGPTTPAVPAAVVVSGGTTLASGTTVQLSATYTDTRGRTVPSATFSWSSSNAAVASVSGTGLVLALQVGTATISAVSSGTTGSASVTVTPGAPAMITVRTQPAGAAAGEAFTTQPVIELRDAGGNLATASTLQVTASLASGGGTLLGESVVPTSGGVATFTNLAIGGSAGARTLSFSAGGAIAPASSAPLTVTPGPPAAMGFRVQPAGAGLNSTFAQQPVVEVRDAWTNPSPSYAGSVTVQVTSGAGGVTGGTAAVTGGVATFTGLGVTGPPGPRTLTFSAPGLSPLTFQASPCDPARAPSVGFGQDARSFTRYTGTAAFEDIVPIIDRNGSCVAMSGVAVSLSVTGATGWVQLTSFTPTAASLRFIPGSLGSGLYHATLTAQSTNGGTSSIPVQLTLRRPYSLSYGGPTQRVNQVDPAQALVLPLVVRDTAGNPTAFPTTLTSRSPSVATVAPTGTVTGVREGQAWVVAQLEGEGDAADSVFVNVTRGPGPVLRTDLTTLDITRGTTLTVELQLDTRGATVAGAQLVLTWPSTGDPPGMLSYQSFVAGGVGNPQVTIDAARGTARVSLASATGMTGVIPVARFTLTANVSGPGQVTTRFIELLRTDQASLLDVASAFQYSIVVR